MEDKYKIKKLGIEEFDENPFLSLLGEKQGMMVRSKQNSIIAKSKGIVDLETGEVENGEQIFIGTRKYVDKTEFVKLYTKDLSYFFDLPRSAQKILQYIFENLERSVQGFHNAIILDTKDLISRTGMVRSTYERMLRILLVRKILARSKISNVYFLNPLFICKSERYTMYQEYVKRTDPKTRQLHIDDVLSLK